MDTKAPMATADLPRCTISTKRHRDPRVPTRKPGTPPTPRVHAPPPRVQSISTKDIPYNHQTIAQRQRSQSGPNQSEPATTTEQPVAHLTRYQTTEQTVRVHSVLIVQRKYPAKLLNLWCNPKPEEHTSMPVLDK